MDKDNVQWQLDVATVLGKVGDVLVATGDRQRR